mmetsp:Transcript_6978/g.15141  ORF Transcript_6978/g.15141 Transcript_6978/m.15141 type:complete len:219 (-) Transcript_6978:528-1184(-)
MPDNQVLVVEFLWEVEVRALSAMADRTTRSRLGDHVVRQTVGCGIAEAVLGERGVEPLLVLRPEYFDPARGPGIVVEIAQDILGVLQGPKHQLGLLQRKLIVPHAFAAYGEGVEVGNNGFHELLSIGDEQGSWVHGLALVILEKHHRGLRIVPNGVQVHIHEGWLGPPPRLPTHDWRDVLPHDVGLPHQRLRQLQAKHVRRIVVKVDDTSVVDLELGI